MVTESLEKVENPPLDPIKSKVVRMMLTSRMQLGEKQQKVCCDKHLTNYMEHIPEWLKLKDDSNKNWMDLDNKMTETICLVRAIGKHWFLLPDYPEHKAKCEEVEKLLFSIMNTLVYLINKICFAPNSPECDAFDANYARSRFLVKLDPKLAALEDLIEGPFILGDMLPVHMDYLLYACLYDIDLFMPGAYEKSDKLCEFMDKFLNYPSPVRRWFRSDESKVGEYIRPPVPHIFELLPEEMK